MRKEYPESNAKKQTNKEQRDTVAETKVISIENLRSICISFFSKKISGKKCESFAGDLLERRLSQDLVQSTCL